MSDSLSRLLAELPLTKSDPARADRIKIACRARLARQAARAPASRNPAMLVKTTYIWLPLTVVLAVAYLAQVIVQALRVYGP